jgi:hypothetical protein
MSSFIVPLASWDRPQEEEDAGRLRTERIAHAHAGGHLMRDRAPLR